MAAADYAKQQPWARAERVGATGFCGGGALALHFSAEYPGVTAVVPWYGCIREVTTAQMVTPPPARVRQDRRSRPRSARPRTAIMFPSRTFAVSGARSASVEARG